MTETEQNAVLTISDVAKRLRVSERLVRMWCDKGMIKGIKLGGSWRVRSDEVDHILQFGTRKPDTEKVACYECKEIKCNPVPYGEPICEDCIQAEALEAELDRIPLDTDTEGGE